MGRCFWTDLHLSSLSPGSVFTPLHLVVAAEHGPGRNRCPYLGDEWGERAVGYFRRVKKLFDPCNVLNPGVLFACEPITAHYDF